MNVRVLGRGDRRTVVRLVDADPVLNVFVASRLAAGVLERHAPGELWGYPARDVRSIVHVGSNLVPVDADAEARRAFAERMGPYRPFCAIVGLSDQVHGLLRDLTDVAAAGPIAIPRDWFSYQELRNLGLQNLLGVTEPEQMFKLLKRGRVKLIVADRVPDDSPETPASTRLRSVG